MKGVSSSSRKVSVKPGLLLLATLTMAGCLLGTASREAQAASASVCISNRGDIPIRLAQAYGDGMGGLIIESWFGYEPSKMTIVGYQCGDIVTGAYSRHYLAIRQADRDGALKNAAFDLSRISRSTYGDQGRGIVEETGGSITAVPRETLATNQEGQVSGGRALWVCVPSIGKRRVSRLEEATSCPGDDILALFTLVYQLSADGGLFTTNTYEVLIYSDKDAVLFDGPGGTPNVAAPSAATPEFGGLGIEVTMENGLVKVILPIEDMPASRAGVLPGDYISHIDGDEVRGLTLSDAVDKMRGAVNKPIELTIIREGKTEPITLSIVREVIKVRLSDTEMTEAYQSAMIAASKGQHEIAIESLRNLATHSHFKGTDLLASFYAADLTNLRDPDTEIAWFERAANEGGPNSAYLLGLIYSQGKGVEKDMAKAIYWMEKASAADQGEQFRADTAAQLDRMRAE